MASPNSPPEILTSLPSSTKNTAYPVSWQNAMHRSRATSAFSSRRSITSRPSSDSSASNARRRDERWSSGRRVLASMHRSRTASVIEEASISRNVSSPPRAQISIGGAEFFGDAVLVTLFVTPGERSSARKRDKYSPFGVLAAPFSRRSSAIASLVARGLARRTLHRRELRAHLAPRLVPEGQGATRGRGNAQGVPGWLLALLQAGFPLMLLAGLLAVVS